MLETKAASVAKRMSTAMFVHNDIRSKYTGFPSKSIDYAVKYKEFCYYFRNIHVQDSFTVCMHDKIGVFVYIRPHKVNNMLVVLGIFENCTGHQGFYFIFNQIIEKGIHANIFLISVNRCY